MKFNQKWWQSSAAKKSLLCVGLDPLDIERNRSSAFRQASSKLEGCLNYLDQISPFAAAVKINRNFIKDLSRKETQKICQRIHELGMIAIDDSKLCDVGSSNESGFYQAAQEGFDAVTYCPFPGNIAEATAQAHQMGLGIIVLILMSNPEFQITKVASLHGQPIYHYYAEEVVQGGADAVVIGALSPNNQLQAEEIRGVAQMLEKQLVLIPGLGHQEGDISLLLKIFGERAIINVGRAIMDADDSRERAQNYKMYLNALLENKEESQTSLAASVI